MIHSEWHRLLKSLSRTDGRLTLRRIDGADHLKPLIPHDGRKNKNLWPSSGKGHLYYGRCRAFGGACPAGESQIYYLVSNDPRIQGRQAIGMTISRDGL